MRCLVTVVCHSLDAIFNTRFTAHAQTKIIVRKKKKSEILIALQHVAGVVWKLQQKELVCGIH